MTQAKVVPLKKGAKCPMCGRPTEQAYRPFCSRRCADQDLGQWLSGSYRIPSAEPPEPGEEVPEDDGKDGGKG